MSRRQALRTGLYGLGGLTSAGALLWYFLTAGVEDAPADIFKGDAPTGELWDLWQRRGWVKEARHYLKIGSNVQCKICPNNCILAPGDRSHCRNKVNYNGTLYTMTYGNPCTFHLDPVEKKPLFHFLPGSLTFSLATSGCVFRCLNCQNWEISQKKPEETKDPHGPPFRLRPPLPDSISLRQMQRLSLFPEDLVATAKALACPSLSYTYSEPTAYFEYAYDSCQAAHAAQLKNILVTCGSIEERPLRELLKYVDAAHVDLKGFDESIYRRLNSGHLEPVLNTLKIYRSLGIWFEIINLVVPTYTDDPETIRRLCDWIVAHLGPDQPLHFSRFMPQHQLTHLPPTPIDVLLQARSWAHSAGLRYVYLGNVRDVADAATTYCPQCKRAIVERNIYTVTKLEIEAGRCVYCRTPIPGHWI